MKYPEWMQKYVFGDGIQKNVTASYHGGLLCWLLVSLFFYSYLQQEWLSDLFFKMQAIFFILSILATPLVLRSITFAMLGMAFELFNMTLSFYFKIGEVCLAHIYVDSQYRFSDSLNLPYPDNWIVFGIFLLPPLGVFFTTYYVGTDFRSWYERCKLPMFLDLKNNLCVIDRIQPDKPTDKLLTQIEKKYDKVERHYQEHKWYQLIFRWIGQAAMAVFILSSLGAQAIPFVMHGASKNSAMLLGYVILGSFLFCGVAYYIRRAHFQYLFEKDLGVHLLPVIRIPDYKPEMNEGIVISKEPVDFPKNQSKLTKWFNSL